MGDLGLLMNDPMAQACAEGRKTVTRRPMTAITEFQPSPLANHAWRFRDRHGNIEDVYVDWLGREDFAWCGWTRIPGAGTATVGQRVWVRECFRPTMGGWRSWVEYRAGGTERPSHDGALRWHGETMGVVDGVREWPEKFGSIALRFPDGERMPLHSEKWRPSIHMPKWASRTWGTLTSVTPCDLSDIDDAEAQREGFDTATEFLAVVAKLYPGVRWFWRLEIEWDGGGA